MKKQFILLATVLLVYSACNTSKSSDSSTSSSFQDSAQTYLDQYSKTYQQLYTNSAEAEWLTNTRIIKGDSTNAIASNTAQEEKANFTGSVENINKVQSFLKQKNKLTELQIKQLNVILYTAANNPQTLKELVNERIKAETQQTEKLYGFNYKIDGKAISTNEIDERLQDEKKLNQRQKTWEASKEVGKELKTGLVNLRDFRNKTVQGLGYKDYFEYQVADYGMTSKEMMDMLKKFNRELYPLYRELHTYARYEFAKKYGVKEVPDLIPAHWLPNRWGQDWASLVTVEGINLDSTLKSKDAEWIVKQGERLYVSLGFPELPKVFWEKSDLYPAAKDALYKKNNHASAWDMDLNKSVRSLM